jgi:hypothetical protein
MHLPEAFGVQVAALLVCVIIERLIRGFTLLGGWDDRRDILHPDRTVVNLSSLVGLTVARIASAPCLDHLRATRFRGSQQTQPTPTVYQVNSI